MSDKKTVPEMIAVMKAYHEGKTIQCEMIGTGGGWRTLDFKVPAWDWHAYDYRVKPEPKEVWVNEHSTGCVFAYSTEGDALVGARSASGKPVGTGVDRVAVRYREVVEE